MGFRGVIDDQEGEHRHFKLMGESVEHTIDIFTRKLLEFKDIEAIRKRSNN